jgi:hypothetical protein
VAARLVGGEDRARVLALLLRPRDLFARRVLLPLQFLERRDRASPRLVERGKLVQLGIGFHAPISESNSHVVQVIAQQCRVKHVELL